MNYTSPYGIHYQPMSPGARIKRVRLRIRDRACVLTPGRGGSSWDFSRRDARGQRDSIRKDVLRNYGCAPSTDLTPQPPWGPRPELVKTVMQSAFSLLAIPAEEGEFPQPRLKGTASLNEAGLDSFLGWVLKPLRTCWQECPSPMC